MIDLPAEHHGRAFRTVSLLLGVAALVTACSGPAPERMLADPRTSIPLSPPPATRSPSPPSAEPTLESCLANDAVVSLAGTHRRALVFSDAMPGTTYDGRGARLIAYPYASIRPFSVGKKTAPSGVCVLGGLVLGQQPRTLTWDEMKRDYDGDGLRIAGNGRYAVDGLRVDNVEDGIAPRGSDGVYPADGDGFVFRNLYFRYIRDDCVENDEIAGGIIQDSLFDGCNTGISEDPSDDSPQWDHPAPADETLILDHVLLRLQALPGPRGSHDTKRRGHGQLFKWSAVANRLIVRDSVFLVETTPNSDSYFPFPPGAVTENVTIVWSGSEPFTWEVPDGTVVTADRSVWDQARADWLTRHGCTSFESCSKLHDPDPAR